MHRPGAPGDLDSYNTDWMGKYRGASELVLRPANTAHVSAVLEYCHQRRLAVVPQGGNTGLVGGSVPIGDEIVLSMRRMNSIRSFDSSSGTLVADAGCVLETLDSFLRSRAPHAHMMPVDLAAKGSCTIGGMLATNAGGIRVLRYGGTMSNTRGVEVVLANGRVIEGLRPALQKDNTGINLGALFAGSEGTLGVVTGVAIATPRVPESTEVAVMLIPTTKAIETALSKAKQRLAGVLSAFEFWDAESARIVAETDKKKSAQPFAAHLLGDRQDATGGPFHVLVEVGGTIGETRRQLEDYLEAVIEEGVAIDAVVAQDTLQARALWAAREGITEACAKNNSGAKAGNFKYDISLPPARMYDAVIELRERLAAAGHSSEDAVRHVLGFGHFGDGNIHVNVGATAHAAHDVAAQLEPHVYEWVIAHGGSISAEHGVGQARRAHMTAARGSAAVDAMRAIKHSLDARGILNPRKLLPDAS